MVDENSYSNVSGENNENVAIQSVTSNASQGGVGRQTISGEGSVAPSGGMPIVPDAPVLSTQNPEASGLGMSKASSSAPQAPSFPQQGVVAPVPQSPRANVASSAPQSPSFAQQGIVNPAPQAPRAPSAPIGSQGASATGQNGSVSSGMSIEGTKATEYWDAMSHAPSGSFVSGDMSIPSPKAPSPQRQQDSSMGMGAGGYADFDRQGASAQEEMAEDGYYEDDIYADNIAAQLGLPPAIITLKGQIAVAMTVFMVSFVLAIMIFGGGGGGSTTCPPCNGLQGVVNNEDAQRSIQKGVSRCGRADRTAPCILYLQNPRNRELYAKEFYELVSHLTGVPKYLIESENMEYGNQIIKSGYIGMYNVPAFHN